MTKKKPMKTCKPNKAKPVPSVPELLAWMIYDKLDSRPEGTFTPEDILEWIYEFDGCDDWAAINREEVSHILYKEYPDFRERYAAPVREDSDFLVKYEVDGRPRREIYVAYDKEEARELFCKQHPNLRILSVTDFDD